jgi:hypothetical protein
MQRRHAFALALLAGHAFPLARSAGQQPSTRPSLAGCYAIAHSQWTPSLGGDSVYHRIPKQVKLDTIRATQDGWRIEPDIAYPRPNRFPGMPRWTVEHDSLVLAWSNGYSPTRVTVALGSEPMRGVALALNDVNGPVPHAEGRLTRIACSAPSRSRRPSPNERRNRSSLR